ncbi:hypothetical protein MTR67_043956 [Solanum verrucosum]|uniref:Uncharacterized protein n=1 Tax=Solanum verrucosum TaxID=315347 RepID=A0AAF0USE4_SOLVR|nr:hypothetical protein MTR67_043956 [Solanum verrucosum]
MRYIFQSIVKNFIGCWLWLF